ncbi:GntR family transcriptional regulator [Actinoplanes sp. NPDC051859]|uniref:GntR family transcriptional regulator n=1 Tax=Actinoplanes sp. NPDC051859 TaxID=3363909 RepID=UPI003796AF96
MASPKYHVIADDLRRQVVDGTLQPGDRLPTEPQLMETYSVSRNTIRLATGLLINEGLVERVAGRSGGMLVREQLTLTYHASRAEMAPGHWPESDAWFGEVLAQGCQPSQDFSVRIETLPEELAERLGVEADTAAAVRRCIRKVNGAPSSLQDTWYPMDLCEQVPELLSPRDIPQGTTRLLAERGWPQPALEDDLVASMPTPEQVRMLALPPGTPVLQFIRTGFSPTRPVRVSVTVFAGHRNRVMYQLGDPEVINQFREDQ